MAKKGPSKAETAHRKRLTVMRGRALVALLDQQVYLAADRIRGEAQFLIARGSIQGKGHVASAPGEAPNLDTGQLTRGIVARKSGPLKARTESTAPYAAYLEFGTSKMAERPYMRPAAKTVRRELSVNVRKAVNQTIRKG